MKVSLKDKKLKFKYQIIGTINCNTDIEENCFQEGNNFVQLYLFQEYEEDII